MRSRRDATSSNPTSTTSNSSSSPSGPVSAMPRPSCIEITDRVPAGLGDVRRPLLSASDDDPVGRRTDVPPVVPGSRRRSSATRPPSARRRTSARCDPGDRDRRPTSTEIGHERDDTIRRRRAAEPTARTIRAVVLARRRRPTTRPRSVPDSTASTIRRRPRRRTTDDDFRFTFDDDRRPLTADSRRRRRTPIGGRRACSVASRRAVSSRRPEAELSRLEEDVLAIWEKDSTFERSIEQREAGVAGDNEFVFYDGPPFANGLPHYGHLLTGFVKDAIPRYQTMRGRRVERRFGWDCHGLPAEVKAEQELGHLRAPGDHRVRHRQVQRRVPHERAAVHERVARLRHPSGALGRLRQRLQDARPDLHGERHVGVQDPVGQGPDLRGLPGAGVLLALRDAAEQHRDPHGRRVPRPSGSGAHRRFRTRNGRADPGLDDHAVDAAVEPGARRRTRHRLRDRRTRRRAVHPRRGAASARTPPNSARRPASAR